MTFLIAVGKSPKYGILNSQQFQALVALSVIAWSIKVYRKEHTTVFFGFHAFKEYNVSFVFCFVFVFVRTETTVEKAPAALAAIL